MPVLSENVNIATHGQVGKRYIYWVVAGEQFKRPYKIPADPKTFDQRTQRNKFIVAAQIWGNLTAEEKEEWKEKVLKTQYTMTAYNFFIKKKLKEIKKMVKKITHGIELLSNGWNVITIDEIQLDKTTLQYNCFMFGQADPALKIYGIRAAYFSDSTHISVYCMDTRAIGDIKLYYSITEYV